MLEPVPDEPVAVADCGPERALVVADYHAGLEVGLRRDGVEIRSREAERREKLLGLLEDTGADRLVLLGDVGDGIGEPTGTERAEIEALFGAVSQRVPVTVTKGNHDGGIETVTDMFAGVEVADGPGVRVGDVGFCHGHTWPDEAVLRAPTLCTAHEHPLVRLEDEVGGSRTERTWLRGRVDAEGFPEYEAVGDRMVVCPAFNDLSGGTVVNEAPDFLSPFLPDGLADADAYLLDGTRLGDYRHV
ncbi:metallophosphoesterase [Natronomonas salina]|uniref:metallophosphoesterase n=1 Tax=Natronomonas salina TaxID=1710540 RepID=UPI0015B521C4|nr:metallophosphoesterase [Natronomonas salina]QLD87505.1 metallophosphoesterase [Natronomonas salina]